MKTLRKIAFSTILTLSLFVDTTIPVNAAEDSNWLPVDALGQYDDEVTYVGSNQIMHPGQTITLYPVLRKNRQPVQEPRYRYNVCTIAPQDAQSSKGEKGTYDNQRVYNTEYGKVFIDIVTGVVTLVAKPENELSAKQKETLSKTENGFKGDLFGAEVCIQTLKGDPPEVDHARAIENLYITPETTVITTASPVTNTVTITPNPVTVEKEPTTVTKTLNPVTVTKSPTTVTKSVTAKPVTITLDPVTVSKEPTTVTKTLDPVTVTKSAQPVTSIITTTLEPVTITPDPVKEVSTTTVTVEPATVVNTTQTIVTTVPRATDTRNGSSDDSSSDLFKIGLLSAGVIGLIAAITPFIIPFNHVDNPAKTEATPAPDISDRPKHGTTVCPKPGEKGICRTW